MIDTRSTTSPKRSPKAPSPAILPMPEFKLDGAEI